jgi:hypothetical protein
MILLLDGIGGQYEPHHDYAEDYHMNNATTVPGWNIEVCSTLYITVLGAMRTSLYI